MFINSSLVQKVLFEVVRVCGRVPPEIVQITVNYWSPTSLPALLLSRRREKKRWERG